MGPPSGSADCLEQYLAEIDQEQQKSIEVGTDATLTLSPDLQNSDLVGPLGIRLTENGQAIGALKYLYFPSTESFKVTSVVDANCQETVEYDNLTRPGRGGALVNWDSLAIHLPAGSFRVRMRWDGIHIKVLLKPLP